MKIKNIITIMMIAALLVFPQRAYGNSNFNIYYLCFDESGNNYWQSVPTSEDIKSLLNHLFAGSEEKNSYSFPAGTKVLAIDITENHLTVNISPEICDFGGGTYLELALINQILKTTLDIPTIEKVTLLVDNQLGGFPEGTVIKEATTWQEMTEETTTNCELLHSQLDI